jgi:hypothetical protein
MSNEIRGVPRQDFLSILPAAAATQLARSVLSAIAMHRAECEHDLAVPGSVVAPSHLRLLAALVVQFGDLDAASQADVLFRQAAIGDRKSLEALIAAANRIECELGPWASRS